MLGLTPCRLLAMAVLETAVRDAHAGSMDARRFLEQDSSQLIFWCGLLGVHPATVRRAAEDPGWPARCAKAKLVFAASWLRPGPPGQAPSPSPADGPPSGVSDTL